MFQTVPQKIRTILLEDTNLVSNLHSFAIVGKTNESLLETKRGNKSVDLSTLNVVELVDGVSNLALVGTEINEEGENVLRLQPKLAICNILPQSSS